MKVPHWTKKMARVVNRNEVFLKMQRPEEDTPYSRSSGERRIYSLLYYEYTWAGSPWCTFLGDRAARRSALRLFVI